MIFSFPNLVDDDDTACASKVLKQNDHRVLQLLHHWPPLVVKEQTSLYLYMPKGYGPLYFIFSLDSTN